MTVKSPAERRHERFRSAMAHAVQTSRRGEAMLVQRVAECAVCMEQLSLEARQRNGQGRRAQDLLYKLRRAFGDDEKARCERLFDIEVKLEYRMIDSINRKRYRPVLNLINQLVFKGRQGTWVNWPIK